MQLTAFYSYSYDVYSLYSCKSAHKCYACSCHEADVNEHVLQARQRC